MNIFHWPACRIIRQACGGASVLPPCTMLHVHVHSRLTRRYWSNRVASGRAGQKKSRRCTSGVASTDACRIHMQQDSQKDSSSAVSLYQRQQQRGIAVPKTAAARVPLYQPPAMDTSPRRRTTEPTQRHADTGHAAAVGYNGRHACAAARPGRADAQTLTAADDSVGTMASRLLIKLRKIPAPRVIGAWPKVSTPCKHQECQEQFIGVPFHCRSDTQPQAPTPATSYTPMNPHPRANKGHAVSKWCA